MSFLKCKPSVFVFKNKYIISATSKNFGILSVEIDGQIFHQKNSGVLSSENNFFKIAVPQELLNKAKKYTIKFRKTINRKAYFSTFEDEVSLSFTFKPIEKDENINVYHVADVHYNFESAVKTCSYFGSDLDLLIVNGDIGEVETEENYFEVLKFTGDISEGKVPIIFVRGNHDTRGRLAERFTEFFPADNENTFFPFSISSISGIALDCGEDKLDDHPEYNSVNDFKTFRQNELQFLKDLERDNNKYYFAVCHICPNFTFTGIKNRGTFVIETETYQKWTEQLERLNIDFMICGHYHYQFIVNKGDELNIIDHNYPVIVGSGLKDNKVAGCALILDKNKTTVMFTDENHAVLAKHEIVK